MRLWIKNAVGRPGALRKRLNKKPGHPITAADLRKGLAAGAKARKRLAKLSESSGRSKKAILRSHKKLRDDVRFGRQAQLAKTLAKLRRR